MIQPMTQLVYSDSAGATGAGVTIMQTFEAKAYDTILNIAALQAKRLLVNNRETRSE